MTSIPRVAPVTPPRVAPATTPRIVPAYVMVLAVIAVLGIVAGHQAGEAYQAARADGSFPPEVRRIIAFGALFNAAVLVILVVAWLAEMAAAIAWSIRMPAARRRVMARLALTLLPLTAFAVGHLVANPWALGLLGPLGAAVRTG